MLLELNPRPREIKKGNPIEPVESVQILPADQDEAVLVEAYRLADDLKEIVGLDVQVGKDNNGFPLRMGINHKLKPQGYQLKIGKDGIQLQGADPAGLFYGGQTMLQLFLLGSGLHEVEISDWPYYPVREIMLDLGRSPYSLKFIKRIIRVMGRLKLNSLHLHLYDDQLNSLRFGKLPLGSENPLALTMADLREIVLYARKYHVTVVPELESWGHVASIIYHYPELYGAPGTVEGSSFGIGEELYTLLTKMYSEVLPVLEEECTLHLGLDEARWVTLPSVAEEDKDKYTPTMHCLRLYNILQDLGREHGRKVKMRLWADHSGRPLPEEIKDEVTIEPWQYWERCENDIKTKLAQYGNSSQQFMMGAGASGRHFQGTYGATRIWCEEGKKYNNALGVDLCLWEGNLFPERLVTVYAGADYAWGYSDKLPTEEEDLYHEKFHAKIMLNMLYWQMNIPDADQEALLADRGPAVWRGTYLAGPLAGKPVAPTVLLVKNRKEDTWLK